MIQNSDVFLDSGFALLEPYHFHNNSVVFSLSRREIGTSVCHPYQHPLATFIHLQELLLNSIPRTTSTPDLLRLSNAANS